MSVDQTNASDLLSRILDEVEPLSSPTAPAEPSSSTVSQAGVKVEAERSAPPPISPDLISLLPSILSALPQGGSGAGKAGGAKGHTMDRHTALLCAIKPYLGERRQATAETVLRLCRLWDALSRAGLSSALLGGLMGSSGAEQSREEVE